MQRPRCTSDQPQEEVKSGLDRDVKLGVIKPVPIGEHVTSRHQMVIRTKDGSPRRTIDP